MKDIPLNQKFTLTVTEAAVYFNLGQKKLRRLAERRDDGSMPYYSIMAGNRYLIIHEAFEEFIMETEEI